MQEVTNRRGQPRCAKRSAHLLRGLLEQAGLAVQVVNVPSEKNLPNFEVFWN
jgi:hypothetical protein